MFAIRKARLLALPACVAMASACVSGPAPGNLEGSAYAPGQVAWQGSGHPQGDWIADAPVARGAPTCAWSVPRELDTLQRVAPAAFLDRSAPLGPGDRLEITVLGDTESLSSTYVVESDGTIALRGLPPVMAAGASITELTDTLRQQLVTRQVVRPLRNAVRVALVELSGASVSVGGAVFEPGGGGGWVLQAHGKGGGGLEFKGRVGVLEPNAGRGLPPAVQTAAIRGQRRSFQLRRAFDHEGLLGGEIDNGGQGAGHLARLPGKERQLQFSAQEPWRGAVRRRPDQGPVGRAQRDPQPVPCPDAIGRRRKGDAENLP